MLTRELDQLLSQFRFALEQRDELLRQIRGGIATAEIGGDETLDARGDAGLREPELDVGLGAFDCGDEGVLAVQSGCQVGDGEAVGDAEDVDVWGVVRVGGGVGGGGGGAFEDCEVEVVGVEGGEDGGAEFAVGAEEGDFVDGHSGGWGWMLFKVMGFGGVLGRGDFAMEKSADRVGTNRE